MPYLTHVTQKNTSQIKPLKAISFALGLVPCDISVCQPVLFSIHLSDVIFQVAFDKSNCEGAKKNSV